MTSAIKLGFLTGVSAMALGLALTPTTASAFEEVNWVWNAEVNETVTKTINVNLDGTPTGMLMLEDFQISVGDVTATSTVTGVSNNQPSSSDGGPVEVDLGNMQFTGNYDPDSGTVTGNTTAPEIDGDEFLGGVVNPEDPNGVTMNYDLGTVTVDAPASEDREFDALTELPEVISAATAVANNTTISSSVMVELHEEQVAVGEGGSGNSENGSFQNADKAKIEALSNVSDILNASVDSSATAVANNLSVDLVQESGTDGLMLADVSQTSVADVNATSDVSDISVNSYTGLGSIDRALVNSVATAVGNNKSISVSGPIVAPAVQ